MNELQIFKNEVFGEIRTVDIENKIHFVAGDVAKALGYSTPKDAIRLHCKGAIKHRLLTKGGVQDVKVIPKGDVIRLVTKSKLPGAEKFESWVFDEVIPTIIETGSYSIQSRPSDPQQVKEVIPEDRLKALELIVNCPQHAIEAATAIVRPFMTEEFKGPQLIPTKSTQFNLLNQEKSGTQKRNSSGYTNPFNYKKLKRHLTKIGMSGHILAKECGIPSGNIRNYLSGKNRPGEESRHKICQALGKPNNWLNGG